MTRRLRQLAVVVALVVSPYRAWGQQPEFRSRDVWERYLGRGLEVDQEQTATGLLAGTTVGQTFTPRSERIERLDLITKNRTDPTPGRVRIWRWLGDLTKTEAQQPLWQDDLDLSGEDAPVLRHYFPRLTVTPGATYYLECSRPSVMFYMAGVEEDRYPGGIAFTNGQPRPGWDLWFRTLTRTKESVSAASSRPLPAITQIAAQSPRPPAPFTRKVYLDAIRAVQTAQLAAWSKEPGKHIDLLLFFNGFLAKATGEKGWTDNAGSYLRDAERYWLEEHPKEEFSFEFIVNVAHGVKWLQERQALSAADLATARRLLLEIGRRMWPYRERGAMNRAAFKGFSYAILSDLYPDAPEAAQWRAFSEEVWQDWRGPCDTDEDSSHYNSVWLGAMVPWIRWRGMDPIYREPCMRRLVDRFRDVLTPQGAMPGWGDSYMLGADWGAFAALFESAATATRDGSYKWAAQRIVENHRRYVLAKDPLGCAYEDHRRLVWAYLAADDTVRPTPPLFRSAVISAAQAELRPYQERQSPDVAWFSLESTQSPWKLVMRDGGTANGWYALFGLRPWGGHGHADAPALTCLAADGTIFTHDSAYPDRQPEDHNMLYGVRVRGGTLGAAPDATRVVRFADLPPLTYADIAWQDYPGWGLRLRREVVFVKGLGWWVRDRTDAGEPPVEWYLGPVWHADRLLARGPTWFDVDYPAPNSFRWPLANGNGHLLVYFTPKAEATVDYADRTDEVRPGQPWNSSLPWAVYQVTGPVQIASHHQAYFNTVLLPLAHDQTAAEAAAGIGVVTDGPGVTALTIRRGQATWILAVQDDPAGSRTFGPVTTDAPCVVARESPPGTLAIAVVGAKLVRVGGKTLLSVGQSQDWSAGW